MRGSFHCCRSRFSGAIRNGATGLRGSFGNDGADLSRAVDYRRSRLCGNVCRGSCPIGDCMNRILSWICLFDLGSARFDPRIWKFAQVFTQVLGGGLKRRIGYAT